MKTDEVDRQELDKRWMGRALELAARAAEAGEVPVGAVVVLGDEIVGEGWNRPISSADPTAHAELVAIRAAAQSRNNYRLPDCELYVTLEPCTMCVGAIIHARLKRLIFAATEPKAGVVCSRSEMLGADYFNHRIEWQGGVCAEASTALLQRFFRERREAKKQRRQQLNNSLE